MLLFSEITDNKTKDVSPIISYVLPVTFEKVQAIAGDNVSKNGNPLARILVGQPFLEKDWLSKALPQESIDLIVSKGYKIHLFSPAVIYSMGKETQYPNRATVCFMYGSNLGYIEPEVNGFDKSAFTALG